jgi:ATP-dependent RNA helicase DHX57
MVKTGLTPKSGAGKKQTPKPHTDTDDSYIVFTNSKGKSKEDTNAKANVPAKPGSAGAANTTGTTGSGIADGPKKPDTRTLIGGASWTGKLPVILLSEHCQKQRWEKPEYTMVCFAPFTICQKRCLTSVFRGKLLKAIPPR